MRFSRLVGIAALSAAPALAPNVLIAQASPNSARPVSVGVSAGASVPIGTLGDAVDVGYNVTGHVWFMPPSIPNVGFRGDVGWDSWKFKGVTGSKTSGGKNRALSVTGNVQYSIPTGSPIRPYVQAGVGLYNSKASAGGYDGPSSNDFGFQLGTGIDFKLSGFSTFLDAKFVNVVSGGDGSSSSSSVRWIPISFGVRF